MASVNNNIGGGADSKWPTLKAHGEAARPELTTNPYCPHHGERDSHSTAPVEQFERQQDPAHIHPRGQNTPDKAEVRELEWKTLEWVGGNRTTTNVGSAPPDTAKSTLAHAEQLELEWKALAWVCGPKTATDGSPQMLNRTASTPLSMGLEGPIKLNGPDRMHEATFADGGHGIHSTHLSGLYSGRKLADLGTLGSA